tara:strand:- start:1882 stop:3012 length:1131 start_codon:yes stop_codon:yes gene_type:complete
MQSRREWLRSSLGIGGLLLAPSTLTAEEILKFNPRVLGKKIKLSSNENPYGPSQRVLKAITESFENACRYPYEYMSELQKKLAKKHDVEQESIIITGGSTEALKLSGLAVANQKGEVIAGQPTFLALADYAKSWGASVRWVPVDSNKGYDLRSIEKNISNKTKMIFLCNPNNPTGTLLDKNSLVKFCENVSKRTVIFSDEAYYDYIEDSGYPSMDYLVRKNQDVIVSKTFSKVYGLAGLRIGYLVIRPELADRLFGKYTPYGREKIVAQTNVLAVAAATEALADDEFYKFSLNKAKEEKSKIYKLLDHLNLKYVKSSTNFIFFESKKHIDELGAQMLDKGVMIGRPFPPFYDWCRISTGTSEEVDKFINGMLEVYS